MKQVDFILFEFRRRAQQKVEENMIKKIKSAEYAHSTPKEKETKLNNHNNTTPLGVM
jgi:hypothetical protein